MVLDLVMIGLLVFLEVGVPRANISGLEVVELVVVFDVEVVKLEVSGLEVVESEVTGSEIAALETVWSVSDFFSA